MSKNTETKLDFAKVAANFSHSATELLRAWESLELTTGETPSDVDGYPFTASLDEVVIGILEWKHNVEEWAHPKEAGFEYVHLSAFDDFTCTCGNDTHGQGAFPCDGEGNDVTPDENWADLWRCDRCNLIFNGSTGKIVRKAQEVA